MGEVVANFVLYGHPQGKGRARAFRRGNFIGHYTPEKTRSYEALMKDAAEQAMGDRLPTTEPVTLSVVAVFDIPASWSKKKRGDAIAQMIWPGKKPDLDNIVKAAVDAMNTVVFRDDALIVSATTHKRYGERPFVAVEVRFRR